MKAGERDLKGAFRGRKALPGDVERLLDDRLDEIRTAMPGYAPSKRIASLLFAPGYPCEEIRIEVQAVSQAALGPPAAGRLSQGAPRRQKAG